MKKDSIAGPLMLLFILGIPLGFYWTFTKCFGEQYCSYFDTYAVFLMPMVLPILVFIILFLLGLLFKPRKKKTNHKK